MLDFTLLKDAANGEEIIETSITGKLLLTTPQLNKGTAFSDDEREAFGLIGKLPMQVETLDEQVRRAYLQYNGYTDDLQKNIYLNNLHDKNQVLFYKLLSEHLDEMIPFVYTPVVGHAVKSFSREFRQARGLYISYPHQSAIEQILDNRSNAEVDLIVITDGEGVLGIGDQGIGGMDIPIAKLMIYTLLGGIDPRRTLPIQLDVGTNNPELLADPLYLGWRHPRITGAAYDDFVAAVIAAVKRRFPQVFFQWEDFGRNNARRLLDKYRYELCSFNDDVQGTGAVTLAAVLAAVQATHSTLAAQRIVVFGAGTAGTGIVDQLRDALLREGLNTSQANSRFWLIDKQGLLLDSMQDLTSAQRPYARPAAEVSRWQANATGIELLEVVKQVQPTILIGCSARTGAFNQTIVEAMAKSVARPIILPLSNPTGYSEAHPKDLIAWTQGKAIIAAGSPFEPVSWEGKVLPIAQCNNAFIFPGLGLGVIAVKAKFLSDDMIWAGCQALSQCSPMRQQLDAPLLPDLKQAGMEVARKVALAVAEQAIKEGIAQCLPQGTLDELIAAQLWVPHYPKLHRRPS